MKVGSSSLLSAAGENVVVPLRFVIAGSKLKVCCAEQTLCSMKNVEGDGICCNHLAPLPKALVDLCGLVHWGYACKGLGRCTRTTQRV